MKPFTTSRKGTRGPALLLLLTLLGCANNAAFEEGQNLVKAGQKREALAKFETASQQDPQLAQHRIAAMRTRESLLIDALNQGNTLLVQERFEDARAAYFQALELHPNNPRALEGLNNVQVAVRHAKWLANARTAAESEPDSAQAKNWLRMILSENANHKKALELKNTLDADPKPKTGLALLGPSFRTPITIEFKDAQLKTVFEVVSRTSGLNFLFDKDVRTEQKTSIFLKNSNTEAVVNLTLLTNQLDMRVIDSNTILIYPNTQAKQKEYQSLVVKTFYLANAEAKVVANTLKTILKSKDIVVDEKLNMLILRDTPEAVRLASKLIAVHDIADSEVMLEVEILEVKRTRLQDLGIRWPEQIGLTPIASATTGLTVAELRGLNSTTIATAIGSTTLNAKSVATDANILANPRIRVRNREKAKILIGERVPNITSTSTATGFVGESVNYVDVGLKLEVEPNVSIDNEVGIRVSLEVSSIISQVQTKSGSLAYQIGTRTAQTMLRLKDGENQVLAGLINSEERRTGNKVPGIGEIPGVGRLFGQQTDDNAKTEIILSITPRILRNLQRPADSVVEFDSGTETSLSGYTFANAMAPAPATRADPTTPAASSAAAAAPAVNAGAPSAAPAATGATPPNPDREAPPELTTMSWQAPPNAKVGSTVAVQLLMQSTQPVVNVPMALSFDAQAFQVESIEEGGFLKHDGSQTSFTSRVDPSGQILLTASRPSGTGATPSAPVATFHLRVLSPPTAGSDQTKRPSLRIVSLAPVSQGGKAIKVPLPEPLVLEVAQ